MTGERSSAMDGEASPAGVLANLGNAVVGVDEGLRITYLDDRAVDRLGIPAGAVGDHLAAALPIEHPTDLEAACARALATGRTSEFEASPSSAEETVRLRVHPGPAGLTLVVESNERAPGSGGPARSGPGDPARDWAALRDACEVALDGGDFAERTRRLLSVGRDYLDVADGMLVRVDREDDDHLVELTTDDPATVRTGTESALSETYCDEAVASEGLVGIHDARAAGYGDHPAFVDLGIGCYIGGSVTVDDELYGTVCFLDETDRSRPFSDRERAFVGLIVEWIGRELERRSREHELERYETVVETIDDGIYALDDEGRYTFVNGAVERLTGYDRETILGRHASFLTSDASTEQADRIQEYIEEDVATVGVLETEVRTVEGGTIPVENRFAPLPTRDDGTGRVGVIRNVADRRDLERKLRGLQRTARDLAEARSEAGVCQTAIEACESVLGLEHAGIWRVDGDALVPVVDTENDAELSGMPVDEATALEAVRDGDVRRITDQEELYQGCLGEQPVRTALVVPVGDYGAIVTAASQRGRFVDRDVDLLRILAGNTSAALERARREVDLRATREELRRSNEQLEQFAYAASHDLREPLRMVSNYLQLLERRYGDDLDEEALEYVDYAVDGAERLRDMIGALLEYSRVTEANADVGVVDMNEVVEDALRNLKVRIEETDADVTVGELPTVRGDRSQLVEVVQNLVSNAVEYAGDGPPSVEVTGRSGPDYHEITVADEGVGMSESGTDRAFDLFERLDRTGTGTGTGIGLALCKRIVESHGGDIRIGSEPGEGTTVTVTIPRADDAESVETST